MTDRKKTYAQKILTLNDDTAYIRTKSITMASLLLQIPMLSTCIKYENLENQWMRNTNSRFSVYQKSCKTSKIL